MADLSNYIVNPGPKTPVTGLKAAVTTDSAIVTETIMKVLNSGGNRSEEHTSELQSLMRISYAVFCLKKKKKQRSWLKNKIEINNKHETIHPNTIHTPPFKIQKNKQ